ncbi:ixochymostatin-like [Haemaphysalis longicornis]
MQNLTAVFIFVCAIVCVVVAAPKSGDDGPTTTPDPKACPGWEVWQDCSGDDCREMTCDDPTTSEGCKDCTSGCYCDSGYFRNNLGICVNWDHCQRA